MRLLISGLFVLIACSCACTFPKEKNDGAEVVKEEFTAGIHTAALTGIMPGNAGIVFIKQFRGIFTDKHYLYLRV